MPGLSLSGTVRSISVKLSVFQSRRSHFAPQPKLSCPCASITDTLHPVRNTLLGKRCIGIHRTRATATITAVRLLRLGAKSTNREARPPNNHGRAHALSNTEYKTHGLLSSSLTASRAGGSCPLGRPGRRAVNSSLHPPETNAPLGSWKLHGTF